MNPETRGKLVVAYEQRERLLAVLKHSIDGRHITGAMLDAVTAFLTSAPPDQADLCLRRLEKLEKFGADYAEDFALWWGQQGGKLAGAPRTSEPRSSIATAGANVVADTPTAGAAEEPPNSSSARKRYTDVLLSSNKESRWTYAITVTQRGGVFKEGQSTSQTLTIRPGDHGVFNGKSVVACVQESSRAGDSARSVTAMYYSNEADGLFLVGTHTEVAGADFKATSTSTYEPSYMVYPSAPAVNKQWNGNRTSTTINTNSGVKGQFKASVSTEETSRIGRRETITVPAGSFDCFVIESVGSLNGKSTFPGTKGLSYSAQHRQTMWYSEDYGEIKTVEESQIDEMKTVREKVLTEYRP